MVNLGLRIASLGSVSALLVMPDTPTSVAIGGLLVTSLVTLIKQFMDSRAVERREEQKHRFAMEEMAAASRARAELRDLVIANTEITKESGRKADVALEAANGVNEKIASIAATALQVDRATALATITADRATAKVATDNIRSDIAHLK